MTIEPAAARAKKVMAENKYFVLATNDADGPWAAALAFTFLAPNFLCFFSERSSRHGAAILEGAKVAGVIYDSQSTPENVESIQFSGWGEAAHDRETIASVLRAGRASDGSPPPSEEEIDAELAKSSTVLFRVSIDDAYVLDQQLYNDQGKDGRERFDPACLSANEGQ